MHRGQVRTISAGFSCVPLPELVQSVADGVAFVKTYDHDGRNTPCAWRRQRGGDKDRVNFTCAAHVCCGVKLRLRVPAGRAGQVVLTVSSDTEHSKEVCDYDRSNAALSRAQKRRLQVKSGLVSASQG